MKNFQLNITRIKICIFHAFVLLVLHLFYFNLNWSRGNEKEIIRLINYIESFVINDDHTEFENDFLFINTSYDNRLIDFETETGNQGNIVITNRNTLGTLFNLLARYGNKQKYIICDILFDRPSPEDSILVAGLAKIDRIITPSADFDKVLMKRDSTIFDIKNAPAEYVTFNGLISKINIINTLTHDKTLPLVAYEDISNKHVTYNGLFYHSGVNYVPKSVFPLFYYTRNSIKSKQIDLGTITALLSDCDSVTFNNIIANKILLIGNIDFDVHKTNMGSMPGSLVLFNSFLTFYEGYHLIHWSWFVFSFVFFILLMYYALSRSFGETELYESTIWISIRGILTLTMITIFISLFSSIIFNVHVTVLPVVLYIEAVKWFRKFIFS